MNLFFSSIIVAFLFACGTNLPAGKAGDKAISHNEVKQAETQAATKNEVKKVTISGTVTQTSSYCGGAAPPDFILEQLAQPKPFPDKKFHVIKGDTNTTSHKIILSFTSDTAGNFSFQLEPGTYSILVDEQASAPDAKKYKTETQSIDEDCYKNWWAQPYYLLVVPISSKPTTIKGLNFNFHHRCFVTSDIPCLRYEGPMPQ